MDGFVTTGQGFLSYNMYSYCLNNPISYSDRTGCMPAWEKLGFVYDGSMRDFRRLEQGLSPYSYEVWLHSQQKIDIEIVTTEERGIKITATSATNIRYDQTDDYYTSMLENSFDSNKPNLNSGILGAFSMGGFEKLVATSINSGAMGAAAGFIAGYLLDCYVFYAQKHNLTSFKDVMSEGQSVLIVTWEIQGGPKPGYTWSKYYSWNEKEIPF